MKAIVLSTSDGYEVIYIDSFLYDEGEPLGEGDHKLYFLKLHEEFSQITSKDIVFKDLTKRDESDCGDFAWPEMIEGFKDDYK